MPRFATKETPNTPINIIESAIVKSEPDVIEITSSGYERSALLATSKAIRAETLQIFYLENTFLFVMQDFSPNNYLRFKERFPQFPPASSNETMHVPVVIRGTPNWDNFLEWLRQVHAQEVSGWCSPAQIAKFEDVDGDSLVIAGMFVTAETLTKVPWETVKELLQKHKPILEVADDRWV